MPKYLPLVIWTVIGWAALAISGLLFAHDAAFEKRSIAAQGTIVSSTNDFVNGERRYESTVEWMDREGRAHRYQVVAATDAYPRGDTLSLRYDPANPEDVRRAGGAHLARLIFGLIGGVFLAISLREAIGKRGA